MDAKFDSKEFWQERYEDLSRALAAVMRHFDVDYGTFENWQVYLSNSWGADAIEVDSDGKRVTRSPLWIDQFEESIKNHPPAPDASDENP